MCFQYFLDLVAALDLCESSHLSYFLSNVKLIERIELWSLVNRKNDYSKLNSEMSIDYNLFKYQTRLVYYLY